VTAFVVARETLGDMLARKPFVYSEGQRIARRSWQTWQRRRAVGDIRFGERMPAPAFDYYRWLAVGRSL
jgi:hypothetical protein